MKILIVEDNIISIKLMSQTLSKLGYDADVAQDGQEAWEKITKNHYDLIFLDANLPEMSGSEVCALIHKEIPQDQRPIIVAITANAMTGDRQKFMEGGADEYLTKPILPKGIEATLESMGKKLYSKTTPSSL